MALTDNLVNSLGWNSVNGVVSDLSLTGTDATLDGAIIDTTTKLVGAGSVLFDKVNDDVTLAQESSLDVDKDTPATWNFWIKTTSLTGEQYLYSKLATSPALQGMVLLISQSGEMQIRIWGGSGGGSLQGITGSIVTAGVWNWISLEYNGNQDISGIRVAHGLSTDSTATRKSVSINQGNNNLTGSTLNNETPHIGSFLDVAARFGGNMDASQIYVDRNPTGLSVNVGSDVTEELDEIFNGGAGLEVQLIPGVTVTPDPAVAIATGVDPTVVIGDIVTHQYDAQSVVKSTDKVGRIVRNSSNIPRVIIPSNTPSKIIKK